MNKQYEIESAKLELLINRKNEIDPDFYNGIYDRYKYPVLTREHAPLIWQYDFNPETNPYFMKRLGINAVLNSGAIELNGKYYLVARVEGDDRKSFFAVAESDSPVDGFRFWDYPILLPDTCPEETNVYDMRLTKHEDGYIYGVFCSESKDTSVNDLSAAVAAAGIVRTKDLKKWERLDNLKTLNSPQQRMSYCILNLSMANTLSIQDLWMISLIQEAAEESVLVCVMILHMLLLMKRSLQARESIIQLQKPRTVQVQFQLRLLRVGFILHTVCVTQQQGFVMLYMHSPQALKILPRSLLNQVDS